ncbi:MAG: circularly permuted type 2 ATP-grasp protein [Acidimicrobiales bacterium]
MFSASGVPRPLYKEIVDVLANLQTVEIRTRFEQLGRTFAERGVTFALGGEERPFPLDLIPRIIAANEWDLLSAGIRQRVRALEAFLDDLYGPGECLNDGVVPRRLVTSSFHFRREAVGIVPRFGPRITVSGIDIIRDEEGNLRVLEDNVRIPSGISYVIENRRAMTQSFGSLFAHYRVHPVDEYPARLLRALRLSAPEGVRDPTVVVLTPGVHNAAYFEHVLLARLMGVELVEGSDLRVVDDNVHMRTTQGERPVHVIYRRVDDEWLDPLHFRPDSVVGVAGLVNAARAKTVTIANAIGNGVADDKLIYTYVPDIIRYFLHEEPLLENVESYRLEEADVLHEVLEHLERYVVKPVDGSGGKGIVIGPQADEATLSELRAAILENPRGYMAQRTVALSTVPTFVDDQLVPRHVDLRPFAVNDGREVWVLPGGLTRVALPEGALVVNSSQGGGSKDTWVLADANLTPRDEVVNRPATSIADLSAQQIQRSGRQHGPAPQSGADQ